MESTGAHRREAMPSADGLRRRRKEAKTIPVVMMLMGRTLKLQLDLSETIADVKAMIYEQEGINPIQQALLYRKQRLDDDHRTLADYGIQHGPSSTLFLVQVQRLPPFPRTQIDEATKAQRMEAMASQGLRRQSQGANTILVKSLFGEIIKLELDLSETIAGVKAMIYEKEGTHPALQILTFKGRQTTEDYSTLEEYGFENGTIFHLVLPLRGGGPDPTQDSPPKIGIFVRKLDGEIFTVRLKKLTTPIYEVRHKIRSQEGIRQTQQHLVFCGQPLEDERTLADYNIQENSTIHLALGPCGGNSTLAEDEEGLVKIGQDASTLAAAVDEGSSHSHDQQPSESQSQALVASHHEGRNEQMEMEASSEVNERPSMVVNDSALPSDQFIKKQQKRWSKYSVKALAFAITTFVTYLGSASTLFSTGNMVFKISIGAFFIADATLSIMKPPKMGSALVYLSCFLLVLVSYLLLVSFNKHYGCAILPVPLPVVVALLQHKFLSGLMGQQRINSEGNQHQQNIDIEVSGQAHDNSEEDEHFDPIFELSADIVNCGGLITVVFGNSMVGPVSAVGFLFFYTMALGLYLMMVTTVRPAVLTSHARYLAILLKVLLVITLITVLIHGVSRSNVTGA